MKYAPVVVLLAAGSARAVQIPLTVADATMNLNVTVQTQALVTEGGSPSGDMAFDIYARRTRVIAGGEYASKFTWFVQVDNINFGKYGNFTSRMIVQDAWAAYTPWGTKGGSALFFEGGIIYLPFARGIVNSASNQLTVEGHPDMYRGFSANFYSANRTTGAQVRGWMAGKRIGFRGGLYEGAQPSFGDTGINRSHNPALAGFVNFDLIGSEEGTWLYQAVNFTESTIFSLSFGGATQSKALRVAKGVTDLRGLSSTLFFEKPLAGDREVIAIAAAYLYGNGTGSKDTGLGYSLDLSVRLGRARPYFAWESFTSADCPSSATAAQCVAVHTADSRNLRAGVDLYFNKAQNHLQIEGSLNRGQSSWGPQSITVANASYAPPTNGGLPLTSLGRPAAKSLLVHWTSGF